MPLPPKLLKEIFMNNGFKIDLNVLDSEQKEVEERIRVRRLRREKEKQLRRKRKKLFNITVLAVFFIILLVILISKSCSGNIGLKDDPYAEITGIWYIDSVTKYEFKSNGEGSLVLPNNYYAFKYEIIDNTLTIDFESNLVVDANYIYEIADDKLKVSDSKHPDIFYEMQKE